MASIFSVGDAGIDLLIELSNHPKYGEETNIESLTFSLGGNAANFAYSISKLGLKTELVSSVGSGPFTKQIQSALRLAKVKTNFQPSAFGNAVSVIFVGKNGERAISSTKAGLVSLTAPQVWFRISKKLRPGDLVFFGGFFHMRGLHKGLAALLKKIKGKGATTALDLCFDTSGKWKLPSLKDIDFLFLNEIELKKVFPNKTIPNAINALIKNGADQVILKKGAKGASFHSCCYSVFAKPKKVKAVDTTGAGDVFNAGFCFALLNDFSLKQCIESGNFVAAYKIQYHGLALPSKKQLLAFLKKRLG